MIICHCIAGAIAGGAENLVKDLSIEQARIGEQVFVLLMNKASSVFRCIDYEEDFISELTSHGVNVLFADKKSIFGIYPLLQSLRNGSCKGDDKIIVHCHLLKSLLASLMLPKKYFKIIYTHHSMNLKIPKFFYKVLAKRVDGFIGISQACAKVLEEAVGDRVQVIYNSVDQKKIKRKKIMLPQTPLRILMVGSFRWEKNYEVLLNALESLKLERSLFYIDIFGEGEGFNHIQGRIIEKGLSDLVTLKGNNSSMSQEYSNYDLFLMCSVSEGLPISLIEASVAGLPVAITNVGGCKEVVDLLNNGFVFSGTDESSLAKGLNIITTSYEDVFGTLPKNDSQIDSFYIEHSASKHIYFYKGI